jgi:hypothetical protein
MFGNIDWYDVGEPLMVDVTPSGEGEEGDT